MLVPNAYGHVYACACYAYAYAQRIHIQYSTQNHTAGNTGKKNIRAACSVSPYSLRHAYAIQGIWLGF